MVVEYHTPVLAREVLQYLLSRQDGIYADCTLGGGGHAEHILTSLEKKGKLIGFDQDIEAISYTRQRLASFSDRIILIHQNFIHLRAELQRYGIRTIDGILFDLGVSSHQINSDIRGFSFQKDARLDMRMNQSQALDAWTVISLTPFFSSFKVS